MVKYQTMIRLAYKVAKEKGIGFDSLEDSNQFTSQLGNYWSDNKDRLLQLTEEQTENELQQIIEP